MTLLSLDRRIADLTEIQKEDNNVLYTPNFSFLVKTAYLVRNWFYSSRIIALFQYTIDLNIGHVFDIPWTWISL